MFQMNTQQIIIPRDLPYFTLIQQLGWASMQDSDDSGEKIDDWLVL